MASTGTASASRASLPLCVSRRARLRQARNVAIASARPATIATPMAIAVRGRSLTSSGSSSKIWRA